MLLPNKLYFLYLQQLFVGYYGNFILIQYIYFVHTPFPKSISKPIIG